MEEHVALDSKKQNKFVKSLKGIKKLMKETGALPEKPQKEKKSIKGGKIKKKRLSRRGLVYLSHIPHGFYEHQMTEYFKQFGMVTNARVIKSKRTGRSKGHAFVEFRDPAVAQVVAETMNNYLMGKRLIKAVYIPPKDQRVKARRMNWNLQNNPGARTKLNMKKAYNATKSDKEDMKIASKLFTNLTNTKNKLKELGIDYDFFTPVDVPEGLTEKMEVKKEIDEDKIGILDEKLDKKLEKKKGKKDKTVAESNEVINDAKKEKATTKKIKEKKEVKAEQSKEDESAVVPKNRYTKSIEKMKAIAKSRMENKESTEVETDGNEKLKAAGLKSLEDFMSLYVDGVESDSSHEFESEEFQKELKAIREEIGSSDEEIIMNYEESSIDENKLKPDEVVDNSDSCSKELPVKKKKESKKMEVPAATSKPKVKETFMQQMKRKQNEKPAVSSKKPKFEKQNNKKLPSKQLKKKK